MLVRYCSMCCFLLLGSLHLWNLGKAGFKLARFNSPANMTMLSGWNDKCWLMVWCSFSMASQVLACGGTYSKWLQWCTLLGLEESKYKVCLLCFYQSEKFCPLGKRCRPLALWQRPGCFGPAKSVTVGVWQLHSQHCYSMVLFSSCTEIPQEVIYCTCWNQLKVQGRDFRKEVLLAVPLQLSRLHRRLSATIHILWDFHTRLLLKQDLCL